MVHFDRQQHYTALSPIPILSYGYELGSSALAIGRSIAVRAWALLLVIAENKARHHRSR